jgi:hypothetical protein
MAGGKALCLGLGTIAMAFCAARAEDQAGAKISDQPTAYFLEGQPDFSRAGYRQGAALPLNQKARIFEVTKPEFGADPTGRSDSTTAIQKAIDQAGRAGGGIVQIPAGTYRLCCPEDEAASLKIVRSQVMVRGEGITQTFLLDTTPKPRGKSIIKVGKNLTKLEGVEELMVRLVDEATLAGPSNWPTALQVGSWLLITQKLTPTWIKQFGDASWREADEQIVAPQAIRQVIALNKEKNLITLDLPLSTEVYQEEVVASLIEPPIKDCGLESFSLGQLENPDLLDWSNEDFKREGTGAFAVHRAKAIQFLGVTDGWIRDVASFSPISNKFGSHLASNGLELRQSRSITVENVKFRAPRYGGEGGNGYLFSLVNSSDCLLRACTAEFSRHGFSLSGGGTHGNVLHRCLDSQTGRYIGSTGEEFASGYGSDHHRGLTHRNLFDQCEADRSLYVAVYRPFGEKVLHGVTAHGSIFWNLRGTGSPDWKIGRHGTKPLGLTVVASQQGGSGLIMGTSGGRNHVQLGEWYAGGKPPDFLKHPDRVEHEGQGHLLVPQSLYLEQLRRRKAEGRTR